MILLSISEFTLPLNNPVLIFSLILFIILFAPILLNKIKIPHLIGLIIAGAIIGPNGFNIMDRDSSIILFGTVGLLYILFIAGLEIDMGEFKKNSGKSIYFGLLVFVTSMGLGFLGAYYLLDYRSLEYFPVEISILLASVFASHTPIVYPMISKMGVAKNRAVNVTIGGTLFTDILAFLVLAFIVALTSPEYGGVVPNEFWWRLSISILIFGVFVMVTFPIIGRWFFKRFNDNISQYIFVLAMVFLAAFLAELAGIEAIIGAFLAGLALNRLIPHTSPLMNRIEFVGNALFIPFFLIGVGMLIDFSAFFKDFETIKVAIVMTVIALIARVISAWVLQKSFKYSDDERRLIFGLSSAQAAATLAVVLVGYNIILNEEEIALAKTLGEEIEPVRLLGESVLNGAILMILVTCTIASFVAQKGAKNLAMSDNSDEGNETDSQERILIPISNQEVIEELLNFCITVKSKKNKKELYALNVINNEDVDVEVEKKAKKILELASVTASATDNTINEVIRYDLSVVEGIKGVVKEYKISDLIVGMHKSIEDTDMILGKKMERLIESSNITTLVYRPAQPLATIKRHLVIIPQKAEKESGFHLWLIKIWNIARNTGSPIVFYGTKQTLREIQYIQKRHPIQAKFVEFIDWEEMLILNKEIKMDDNLIFVMSRKNTLSYNPAMEKIPVYINKYFNQNNITIIYPKQLNLKDQQVDYNNPSVHTPFQENLERLDDIGKSIGNIFKKK